MTTLRDQLRQMEARRTALTIYAPTADEAFVEVLSRRNATVRHRNLPEDAPPGFAVVHDEDGFVAAVDLDSLRRLLAAPVRDPGENRDPEYRQAFESLRDLVFAGFDRRELLAASREIEDRADRVGEGTLRVGFQTFAAFETQLPVYRRLGRTDLDVHVYVRGRDDPLPEVPGVTLHPDPPFEVLRYWFLAFDGGGDDRQACGLLAREQSLGSYRGFWTYDPGVVEGILSAVPADST